MTGRKKSRSRRAAGPVARMRSWCGRRFAAMRSACAARRRPWRPTVEADVDGRQGRRLRRVITRVTRDHLCGLDVRDPEHLLVVVQRTVVLEERPLESLLQVFEDAEGHRRHVLFLALTASGRDVDDEELLATLRQQLQRIVAPQLGTLLSTPQEPTRVPPEPEPVPTEQGPWVGPFEKEASPLEVFEGRNGAFAAAAGRSDQR